LVDATTAVDAAVWLDLSTTGGAPDAAIAEETPVTRRAAPRMELTIEVMMISRRDFKI
jgi:hypothetical protein